MSVRLYGLSEVGRALGVSRQRARQLYEEGKLPDPHGIATRRPFWLAQDIDQFASARRPTEDPAPSQEEK